MFPSEKANWEIVRAVSGNDNKGEGTITVPRSSLTSWWYGNDCTCVMTDNSALMRVCAFSHGCQAHHLALNKGANVATRGYMWQHVPTCGNGKS